MEKQLFERNQIVNHKKRKAKIMVIRNNAISKYF